MAAAEGKPVSVRIPSDVLASLDRVCRALDRPRSWLVVHALRRFLAEEGTEILAAAKGAAEIDRGESEDMDVVLDELDAIIDAAERKRA